MLALYGSSIGGVESGGGVAMLLLVLIKLYVSDVEI